MNNLSEIRHYIPLSSPVDTAASTVTTVGVDVGDCTSVDFLVFFGSITGDTVVVTVEECTSAAGAGNTAIGFEYRYTAAAGTDTLGAIATATSAGVTVTADDDDKILIISIDPALVAAAGGPYARVVANPGGSASAVEIAILASVTPRNAQNIPASLVD